MSLMRRLNNNQPPGATTAGQPPAGGQATTGMLKRPVTTGNGAAPAPAPQRERNDSFNELKARVQNRLIAELDPRMDLSNAEEVRRTVEETFAAVLEQEQVSLTRVERLRLFEAIAAEILGYGPIEPLLKDDTVSEIMVNGPKQVYVERRGKLELSDVVFNDDAHLLR